MTFWVAGAVVTSAVIGSQGAKSAASTQADAAGRAGDIQKQQFDEQMRLQEPYRQAGLLGQNRLMTLLGLGGPQPTGGGGGGGGFLGGIGGALSNVTAGPYVGGDASSADYGKYARDFSMADYQADPGYAFRLSEGMKQLGSQARAQGGAVSGRTMMGAQNYAQGLASQEYNNAFNRYQTNRTNQLAPLGSLMTSGQNAAAGTGAQAGEYGARISNLMTGAGENQANALLAAQRQNASSYGDIAKLYGQTNPNFGSLFGSSGQSGMYADPTLIPMQAGGGY